MAWQFTTNVLIPGNSEKNGKIWITLKDALVATGRWRVRGSGDGKSLFELDGQTAGIAGSFDVFTASPAWRLPYPYNGTNTISNYWAWVLLEEIASGRVLAIQRNNQSDGAAFYAWAGSSAATSGATHIAPPAMPGSGLLSNGGLLGGQNGWGHTQEQWLCIGAEDSVRAGNVSPWWFSLWSKTSNQIVSGGFWEALTDVDPSVTNSVVTAIGYWSDVFGSVGTADGGMRSANNTWRGGNGWEVCALAYPINGGFTTSPPSYQVANADGKIRTQRPWVLRPYRGSRYIGRFEDFYLNKVQREYPTTYDLAGAQPRLTLGHLITPWLNAVPSTT